MSALPRRYTGFIGTAAGLLLAQLASAQSVPTTEITSTGTKISARPVARANRVEKGPMLTGKMDDPIWLEAPVIQDFSQHEPFEGRPATERTEVRIVYLGPRTSSTGRIYKDFTLAVAADDAEFDASTDETAPF